MAFLTEHDQQKTRRFQQFTDQHNRVWEGIIDLKTGDPIGTLSLRGGAPLIPPPKYVRPIPGEFGRLRIDYDRWIADLRHAHREYGKVLLDTANEMYGPAGAQMVEQRPPALLHRVGPSPVAVEPALAARAGDPWTLGLAPRSPKPAWARRFFPDAPEPARVAADELAFLREGEEEAEAAPESYPVHRGFGRWELSDGSTITGKREEAEAAEAALAEPETLTAAAAAAGAHPSWNPGA